MSYRWFNMVLESLGKRLSFESVSNMYGKTIMDKKSGEQIEKIIQQANPLIKHDQGVSGAAGVMQLPGSIRVIKADNSAAGEAINKFLGR